MFLFGIGFAIYERFLEDQARKSPDLDAKVLILATPRYDTCQVLIIKFYLLIWQGGVAKTDTPTEHGKESLENKVLFCLNPNFGKSVGRGGCLVGRSYVYALLDW